MVTIDGLSPAARTLLIPLLARAMDSGWSTPVLGDPYAAELVSRIDFDFAALRRHVMKHDIVFAVLRARQFDRWVREFLSRHPDSVIVSMGSGLDTRFKRTDNGSVLYYDLDLPEVIEIRTRLLPESERNRYIASSATDPSWLDIIAVPHAAGRPVMLLSEGVLMYIPEDEIHAQVGRLSARFHGAELAFDYASAGFVRAMGRHAGVGSLHARLLWGVKCPWDFLSWAPGLELLEEWSYFGEPEIRSGFLAFLRLVPGLQNMMRLARLRL